MAAEGPRAPADEALKAAIAGPHRSPDHASRDAYRKPYETLAFWGLEPGQAIVEIMPGPGYWTEILAPYAKATGGTFVTTGADLNDPATPPEKRETRAAFEARYADPAKFGVIRYAHWGPKAGPLGPDGSADIVITARNVHNWIWNAMFEKALADIHAVLKPGGIFAVEQHRADPLPQAEGARGAYMETAFVVAALEKAGFRLEAQSEMHANPKDTKDHPFGVWTLPPTRYTSRGGRNDPDFDRTPYEAIGDSDRMTLRFRKPG